MTDDQDYPRIIEVTLSSGRVVRFRLNAPPQPEVFEHYVPEVSGELLDVDQDVETTRPAHIPPLAVSLAAHRFFGSVTPDDHPLAQDWALVRWWWMMRESGLLPDELG